MVVAIFTVLLAGFMLGGSTVYLVENHFRTKEMNKIYKLTESLINGNDLDDSDIGKETLYSKTTNQLIRLQEMLEGRRKEAEKSRYEIQKLISEIAHQLRTPLSNIKNYTELLQESLDETQEVLNTEYMKDLRTSEEQLCFLVTLAADLSTMPIIALMAGRTSLVSLIANLLAGPAVPPVTILGLIATLTACVNTTAASLIIELTRPFLWWINTVADILGKQPWATTHIPTQWLGLGLAWMLYALLWHDRSRERTSDSGRRTLPGRTSTRGHHHPGQTTTTPRHRPAHHPAARRRSNVERNV